MTLHELHRRVKSLNQTLKADVENIVRETSYEIEALNKQQLYNYGVDSDGKKLSPKYRNKSYATEKNRMNRRPGFGQPDGYLTGAWYKGFNVVVKNYSYSINSTDSKSPKLKAQYGKVFGLTSINRRIYSKGVFYTAFKRHVNKKTGLKFI